MVSALTSRSSGPSDTGAMLYQLSYEATHWERGQLIEFISSREEWNDVKFIWNNSYVNWCMYFIMQNSRSLKEAFDCLHVHQTSWFFLLLLPFHYVN